MCPWRSRGGIFDVTLSVSDFSVFTIIMSDKEESDLSRFLRSRGISASIIELMEDEKVREQAGRS